eukprot:CAMPEP_0179089482 /NCGR_PEP_ID=MMETSP0796-20121207/40775_1 /TAXON_ID=73915 /ORGANISM="Pyrodinium bahamense, Strain pbaha01" /LENGTH=501 /DNA_ID=CAMNT_0020787039 /DNA_START=61 /DNA_END=1566 /DNA_ORIENTATION=-
MITIGLTNDGCICDWSSAAETVSGFTRQEVLGLNFINDLCTEGQDAVTEMICYAWMGQATMHVKLTLHTKSGQGTDAFLCAMLRWSKTTSAHRVILSGGPYSSEAVRSVSVDKNGCVTDWGDELVAMTGFGIGEVLGMNFVDDLMTEDERNKADHIVSEALAGERMSKFTTFFYTKSAVKKWFRVQASSCYLGKHLVGATLTFAEAHESEATEAGASSSDAAPAASSRSGSTTSRSSCSEVMVTEADRMIMIGLDKDGCVCEWNSGAEAMSGFMRGEVLGMHFVGTLLDPASQDVVNEQICYAWMGQTTPHAKFPFFTKSGERVELFLSSVLRWSERVQRHNVFLTGRRYTSYALQSITVDTNGCITDWGDELEALTGFSLDDVLGLNLVEDIITPSLHHLVRQKLSHALAGEEVQEFSLPMFSKSGMKILYQVKISQLTNDKCAMGAIFIMTASDDEKVHAQEDTLSTCTGWAGDKPFATQDSLPSFLSPTIDLEGFYGM